MDGLIFSPRRVDNLVDNVRDLVRKANTYSEFVNVAMRVRLLMGRGLANHVNPGNIEPRIWNLYYGRMNDATVILQLTRVYISGRRMRIHSNLSNFLLATSWVLASSKHVRTEHSFLRLFLSLLHLFDDMHISWSFNRPYSYERCSWYIISWHWYRNRVIGLRVHLVAYEC